jgi:uncharacterized protein YutE (UPF0331/DUF86 family)
MRGHCSGMRDVRRNSSSTSSQGGPGRTTSPRRCFDRREALNRLSRIDPLTATKVPDLPRIVAFRNVLVHGYATIEDSLVWEVATTRTDALIATLNRLMIEEPD